MHELKSNNLFKIITKFSNYYYYQMGFINMEIISTVVILSSKISRES